MRDCIIHIGLHKTGSTAIQQSLYRNESLRGISYLDFGRPNGTGAMLACLTQRPEALRTFARNGRDAQEIGQWAQQGREVLEAGLSSPLERVLVSAEGLSHLEPGEILTLRDLLARHHRRAQVVAYVRGAHSFMESAFQQRVKGGLARLNPPGLMPMYRDVIEPWDRAFGPEQVTLYPFEPRSFPQGCVVRDFSQRLGFTLDETGIRRSNTSLSRSAIAMLMLYWRFLKHSGGTRDPLQLRFLVRTLQEVPGGKFRLAPSLVNRAFQRHADQLDWIEQRMGVSMRDMGPDSPEAVHSEQELLRLDANALDWLGQRLGRPLDAGADELTLGQAVADFARLGTLNASPQAKREARRQARQAARAENQDKAAR